MNRRKFFKLLPVGLFATAAYHYGKGIKDNKKNRTALNVYDGDVEVDGDIYLKGNVYENVPVETAEDRKKRFAMETTGDILLKPKDITVD